MSAVRRGVSVTDRHSLSGFVRQKQVAVRNRGLPGVQIEGRESMKRTILTLGLAVCAWLAVGAVPAVAAPAGAGAGKAAAMPAPAAKSASELVLDAWNDIGRKLIAMAEDFPEDKYEFKPTPAQRTFAAQLLHAAGSMYFFTDPADGKKPRYNDDPKRDELKTKAQVVAFVKKAVEDGRAVIKAKGDKGMMEVVDAGNGQMDPVYDLAYGLIEHSGEHYGQLVVYYRVAGLVPPESRPKK
jgi:DinB superfamily